MEETTNQKTYSFWDLQNKHEASVAAMTDILRPLLPLKKEQIRKLVEDLIEAFERPNNYIRYMQTITPPVFGLDAKYFQFLGKQCNARVKRYDPEAEVAWASYVGIFGFSHDGQALCVGNPEDDSEIVFFSPEDLISIEFAETQPV